MPRQPRREPSPEPPKARRPRGATARSPVQSRSKQTVEAILEAAYVLVKERGLGDTTTNAVAQKAGVSIGSLYQYFDNLDGIVAELSRRHVEASLTKVFAEAHALASEPLEPGARKLIRMLVQSHREDPVFHRMLETARPAVAVRAQFVRFEDQVMAATNAYLSAHREELVVEDLSRAAFVVVRTIEGLTSHAALERPALLEDDVLVEDLTRLLVGYLTGRATPPAAFTPEK